MALVSCPECSQSCSDAAAACPHCGFPIRERLTAKVRSKAHNDALGLCLETLDLLLSIKHRTFSKDDMKKYARGMLPSQLVHSFALLIIDLIYDSPGLDREVYRQMVEEVIDRWATDT